MPRSLARVAWVFAAVASCSRSSSDDRALASATPELVSAVVSAPVPHAEPSAVTSATSTAVVTSASPTTTAPAFPGRADGCAQDMVRVAGGYCPALTQNCLDHHAEFDSDKDVRKTVSERCLRYESPSRCVSKKRRELSFCMDRFEYPNRVGELPRVLTSWRSAKKLCEAQGKRLCTEQEFNFACEGPDMLPYVYGFVRDPQTCNIDRPYLVPDHSKQLPEYDACPSDPHCKAEMARLDQREPIGKRTTCVSWAGVFDLNGNVNEWVELPNEKSPNRSGLKGGWWGPIRARCRPTVTFHKESDYGYEAGFRCCRAPTAG